MTYLRVIPRDLFNEAKLLKCLGALVIACDTTPGLVVDWAEGRDGERFLIEQDNNDGDLRCRNIEVSLHGRLLDIRLPYNSRDSWPLYAYVPSRDAEASVFDGEGKLTPEFLRLVPRRRQDRAW